MFTTGSKLFIGATSLSLVGVLVYAATTDGPAFMPGVVGLLTATVLFAFLAGLNLATRDGNVSAADEGAAESCAASRRPAGSSLWPLVVAVSVGGLVVGTVSKPVVFKSALVLLLAAAVEWMVQGWSERASADGAFNRNVRRRMLFPLEFPILGVAVFAVIAYAFSRIMLRLEKQPGMVAFGVISALVLFGGFMFASKRNVSKQVIGGITAVFTSRSSASAWLLRSRDSGRSRSTRPPPTSRNSASRVATTSTSTITRPAVSRPRAAWSRRSACRRTTASSPSSTASRVFRSVRSRSPAAPR